MQVLKRKKKYLGKKTRDTCKGRPNAHASVEWAE